MISTRRVAVASLVAPLIVAVPWFALTYFAFLEFSARGETGAIFARVSPAILIGLGAAQFYVFFGLFFAAIAGILKLAKALTRRNILLVCGVVSVALSLWFGCAWEDSCMSVEALKGVLIQFGVCLVLFGGTAILWWRIAASPSAQLPQGAGRQSEA